MAKHARNSTGTNLTVTLLFLHYMASITVYVLTWINHIAKQVHSPLFCLSSLDGCFLGTTLLLSAFFMLLSSMFPLAVKPYVWLKVSPYALFATVHVILFIVNMLDSHTGENVVGIFLNGSFALYFGLLFSLYSFVPTFRPFKQDLEIPFTQQGQHGIPVQFRSPSFEKHLPYYVAGQAAVPHSYVAPSEKLASEKMTEKPPSQVRDEPIKN